MKGLAGGFPLRCCIALAALAMNALALNLFVVPSTGSYPSYGGFAAALAAALAYAALLAVAVRRPDALLRPSVPWAGLALFCAGSALVAAGYRGESTAASLAGWLLAMLATAWLAVLAGLVLARLSPRPAFAAVPAAYASVYVAASVLMPFVESLRAARLALLALYVLTFLVAFACTVRPGLSALAAFADQGGLGGATRSAKAAGSSPARAEAGGPPKAVLFAVLLALGLASGYTAFVVYGSRESAGVSFVAMAAAMLAVIAASRFSRGRTDVVFHFGLLLVLAGLLVVPFVAQTSSGERVALIHVSNTLLAAGSECFAMLVWIVLAARVARRPAEALVLQAGGRLAVALGMLGGLVLGTVASSFSAVSPLVPDAVAVAFAFALVAYALVGLRRFSFEDALSGGEGVPQAAAPERDAGRRGLGSRCGRCGCRGCGGRGIRGDGPDGGGFPRRRDARRHRAELRGAGPQGRPHRARDRDPRDARARPQRSLHRPGAGYLAEHGQDAREAHLREARRPFPAGDHRPRGRPVRRRVAGRRQRPRPAPGSRPGVADPARPTAPGR